MIPPAFEWLGSMLVGDKMPSGTTPHDYGGTWSFPEIITNFPEFRDQFAWRT